MRTEAINALYRNLKDGRLYELVARGFDATNSRAGTRVAIYRDPTTGGWYAREELEFEAKFRKEG